MSCRVLAAAFCAAAVAAVQAGDLGVREAADYSAAHGETDLVVWRAGQIVYSRGERDPSPPRVFSITKSLVAIGVFRDAGRGGLSLGEASSSRCAAGVPLVDLLNQTSGLPSAAREFYSEGLKDKQAVLGSLRRNRGSGSFVYGPSHWEVLAEEIRSRRAKLGPWLRKYVPGANRAALARWRCDDNGTFFFSTGARMDAVDLLPAGREVLSGLGRGKWPPEVRQLLSAGTGANPMYALGFWLNRAARSPGAREIDVESSLGPPRGADFWHRACLCRTAPADLLAMIGTRGQRVYVVPSQDLVVIRLGNGRGFSDAAFLRRLFG